MATSQSNASSLFKMQVSSVPREDRVFLGSDLLPV